MKKFFVITMLIIATTVLADDPSVYLIKKDQVLERVFSSSYIGAWETCYKGDPWKVRELIKKWAKEDVERVNPSLWYEPSTGEILFSFVSQGCLDDSLDDEGCGSLIRINQCQ